MSINKAIMAHTVEATCQATPFCLSQVRLLDGPFKTRQDVNRRHLLAIEVDRLLAPFRAQSGLPAKAQPYGGWEARDIRGHSLGHYLSALSLLWAGTGDPQMRERVEYIVDELAECQQEDGYLLPVEKAAFEKLKDGHIEASGFSLNGVWVPFYTLHKVLAGLRDAYRYTGSFKALDVESKVSDWLDGILSPLDAQQIQEVLRSEHGGMNEVLADLTSDTGDTRYLRMAAEYFHHAAVLGPMFRGEDTLDGMHGNTQIPKVIGLAREYEMVAESTYRVASETLWDGVVNRRSFAIGGHGENEHFFPVAQFPEKLTATTCETCNTYNMLKLAGHLFAWEPQAAQMDFVERAMINHLLANIGREPGEFGYFLGLGSVGYKTFSTPFDSWWCCVGTGLENPTRYAEQAYFHGSDGGVPIIWANLYIGSELQWPEQGISLCQTTSFPDEANTRLEFSCEEPRVLRLNLRHPYWCEKPEIKINGIPFTADSMPSSYLSIERQWRRGDTVEVHLPMALHAEPLPSGEDAPVALMYGPIVLAGVVPDQPGVPNPSHQRFSDHLKSKGKTDALPPILVGTDIVDLLGKLRPTNVSFAEFQSVDGARPDDLRFVPFYRIYEEQYAVYFPVMTLEQWTERETDIRFQQAQQRTVEAGTVDIVFPGFQQSEVEHGFRAENSEVGDFGERKYRSIYAERGWFSYEMAADPVEPLVLAVTYWGGIRQQGAFDITIDGQTVGAQPFKAGPSDEFFCQEYPLDPALTRDKNTATIRFGGHAFDPNADLAATGIFEVKVTKAKI
jgi:hypothetical protein